MTDNELKEDCLQEAGIDLGRYSYDELTNIKDALRRYSNAKLKLLGIADVVGSKPTRYEKNNLPLEIRYAYNEGVELHQKIVHYETGVIDKNEFIQDVILIKNRYK